VGGFGPCPKGDKDMSTENEELKARLAQVEARLADLEGREQIRRLIGDYRRHLDERDWHSYSQLFAEDGTWSGGRGEATGPEAIRTMLEAAIPPNPAAPGPTVYHLGTDPVIDIQGDRATAFTIWFHVRRGADDEPELPVLGHYNDVFTRESGRWLFLRREAPRDIPVT
jgi:hypothetical protein